MSRLEYNDARVVYCKWVEDVCCTVNVMLVADVAIHTVDANNRPPPSKHLIEHVAIVCTRTYFAFLKILQYGKANIQRTY